MSASLNPAASTVLVESFDVLLLDLDGVIYIGRSPVQHAAIALEECARDSGTRFVYVTNNASRTPQDVAQVLAAVGVRAESEDIVTSAQVAANRLAQIVERGSSVLVVGGDGLEVALRDVGLVPVRRLDDEPVAVVQGFHPDIGWRDLAQAAGALHKGLPWIASNADLTLPTELGIAPGNGALIAALSTAVGRYPEVVGKPFAPPIVEAVRRSGATSPLIVGDRLDTDIEAAHAAGFPSLLVFTGVSGVADVCKAPARHRPTYLCRDLCGLNESYAAPEISDSRVSLGGWSFSVENAELALVSRGSGAIEGVRALAAACWLTAEIGGLDCLDPLPPWAQALAAELAAYLSNN